MVKITRENFKRIYSEKIREHSKELEEYDGELPIIFYEYINIKNRREYLESIGKFYEYANLKELRRGLDADKQLDELIQFVNMNEEFQDIVKIKE